MSATNSTDAWTAFEDYYQSVRKHSRNPYALEVAMLDEERRRGLFSLDLDSLPPHRRTVAEALSIDLKANAAVIVSADIEPERYREGFGLRARFNNIIIYMDRDHICVLLVRPSQPDVPADRAMTSTSSGTPPESPKELLN